MLTREQLINNLKEYKGLLSKEIIDYLNDVINLEYSVLRDDMINIDTKRHLSEIDIYKQVATYNIYNRTKKLINEFDIDKTILIFDWDKFDWCSAIVKKSTEIMQTTIDLYSFFYGNNNMVENNEFGYLQLHRYLSIEELIDDTSKKIELLAYEKSIFDNVCSSNEKYERNAKYNNLKKYYSELLKYQDSEIPNKLEYVNKCVDMLASDYGLESSKCLMIKKPGITIAQHINKI